MDYIEFKEQFHLKLDEQKEAAVQSVDGPVLLLAVPGSGKTTVLVSRIGYMRYVKRIPADQILTMTYTVAAARDMRQRYASFFGETEANKLEFRTINGVCSRIIQYYERTTGHRAFQLLEDGSQKSALLAELCRSQTNEFVTESTIKTVQTAITYTKNMMLKGEQIESVEVEGINFPPIYQSYCKILRERKLMDYDDQMVYALQILRQYPKILRAVQCRYRYFCVDEAQDTSKIQHRIIQLLASQSHNLFMVGDEDQSIYGFRAAYPQALAEFERLYPSAKILYMEQNYRSTQEIVAVADKFIQKNKNRHPKHIRATRGSGPVPREVSVYDRQAQYRYLCKLAQNCDRETAVLYRDNDSALPLIDLLDRANIPYRCRQVESLFFTNRVVRDITNIIRFAMDPDDGDLFMDIYYKLGAGISKNAATEAVSRAEGQGVEILDYIAGLSTVSAWTKRQCRALQTHSNNLLNDRGDKAVYRIVHFMGYGEYLENRGIDPNKVDILEALGAEQHTPEDLLNRLDELREVVLSGSSGVSDCSFILSTVHSSKGLEYDRVILMDVMDGVLPKVLPTPNDGPEELEAYEEERRLFYVGMTRAKNELSIITYRKPGLNATFTEEVFPKKDTVHPALKVNLSTKKLSIDAKQVAAEAEEYTVGIRLRHKIFGPGTLSVKTGDIVSIEFDNGTDKRFSLSSTLKMGLLKIEDR